MSPALRQCAPPFQTLSAKTEVAIINMFLAGLVLFGLTASGRFLNAVNCPITNGNSALLSDVPKNYPIVEHLISATSGVAQAIASFGYEIIVFPHAMFVKLKNGVETHFLYLFEMNITRRIPLILSSTINVPLPSRLFSARFKPKPEELELRILPSSKRIAQRRNPRPSLLLPYSASRPRAERRVRPC